MGSKESYSEAEERRLDEQIRDEMEERWARGEETVGPMYRRRRPAGRTVTTVEVAVALSAERWERLRELAESAGTSPEKLIREWTEQRIENEARPAKS